MQARREVTFLGLAALVALGAAGTARAQTAELILQSQPGDYIGQGGSYDVHYTPAMDFFSAQIYNDGPGATPGAVLFTLGTVTSGADNTFSLLEFSTNQIGLTIQPGVYLNAQRAPFAAAGHPGLDVSFQNRGSNTLTGNFTINGLTFAQTPTGRVVNTFDVNFEQHSEGGTPALFGHFLYNSGLAAPEPPQTAALGVGALALGALALKARRRKSVTA